MLARIGQKLIEKKKSLHLYNAKPIVEKIKSLPDENSNGLGIQRKTCKKKTNVSDDFEFRRPVIQNPFRVKRATSSVARANR